MGAGVMRNAGGGRRRRGARGKSAMMAEINVTPFVDVMLVLLIIFMVAAPLLTVGVPLDLPKTQAAAVPTQQEEPLTISRSGGRHDQPAEHAGARGRADGEADGDRGGTDG